jgi:hypothetical protein
MTLSPASLIESAVGETGLEDFGGESFHEPLERLCAALEDEAGLTTLGHQILGTRLVSLLANRLRIEDFYRTHPGIDDEEVEGPVFVIGLPRTGTTALSNLLARDPQIRSLRLWESASPVPPPEATSQDTDDRIAAAEKGLEAMYEAFPRMRSLYFQTATGPTECQDLLGMEMRTSHFDGMAHVPSYISWVLECDMRPAYRYHKRTLKLLQWRCPPRLWHLKTPVHSLYLDHLDAVYPRARFIWTHRDPAEVLGSVCSLILHTRSWVSDRDDSSEIGRQQAGVWALAMRRSIAFRNRVGEARFADVRFGDLEADPVGTLERAYETIGLAMGSLARERVSRWASDHPKGEHGAHEYGLGEVGLEASGVRKLFSFYTERFGV